MTAPTKISVSPDVARYAPTAVAGLEGLHTAITEYYGERCPEHEDGCPACDAWKAFNDVCGLFEVDPAKISRENPADWFDPIDACDT